MRTSADFSVFVVPASEFKGKRNHVLILNDVAWPMNDTAFQSSREAAGLPTVRVHDFRHT
jgi:hypothetical protein